MTAADLTRVPLTDPTRAYRYRDGLYAADLLTAAIVHLDLFSWLAANPTDLAGICDQFGLHARPADVLMTLCAASGFVERHDEICVVTDTAREHLTSTGPWNLAPYYASLKDRPVTKDFLAVLRTGRPAHWGGARDGADWHTAMETESFARSFTAAMDCRGIYLGQAMAKRLALGGHRRVLDVGGGSGIYACSLVAHHPHLAVTVFDQPPVDRIARTLVAERGFAHRVTVHAGNFLTEPWPVGHDVHLLSNVLHDWDEPHVRRLLASSFDALTPGGLIVIHDAFIAADKTGPLPVAEYSALLMHSTQGKCYSIAEYDAYLTAVGFGHFTFAETAADRGVMTAHKPE